MKNKTKKSPIDFKVKIIIYGLPQMGKREMKSVLKYMDNVMTEIETEDPKIFTKRAIFKLMK